MSLGDIYALFFIKDIWWFLMHLILLQRGEITTSLGTGLTDAETNKWCIFSGKEGADTGLRMTGNAGRKQKKGGKWERDGGAVLARSFLMCVSPVFINQSQAVCCRAGVSCSVIWVSGGMCEPHPTPLQPPTHSISHCKQSDSASVCGGTGTWTPTSKWFAVFLRARVFVHV